LDGLDYSESHQRNIRFATAEIERRFRQNLKDGVNIIHAQTNLTVKIRARHLVKVTGYFKSAIVFIRNNEQRMQRFDNKKIRTGKDIPQFIFESMVNGF